MTDMLVSMKLTLEDQASGRLKAFGEELGGLSGVVDKLSASLSGLNSSPLTKFYSELKNLDSSLSGASANLDKFATSFSKFKVSASSVSNFNGFVDALKRATETTPLVSSLGNELNALALAIEKISLVSKGVGQKLTSMGSRAGGASIGVNKLATEVTALTEQLPLLTTELGASAGKMAEFKGMTSGIFSGTKREVDGVTSSLKSMAEIWAGLKLEHGVRKSVDEAAQWQVEVAKMKMLNMAPGKADAMAAQAQSDSRDLKFVSPLQALNAKKATIDALQNQTDEGFLNAANRMALTAANVLKVQGLGGSQKDIIKNLFSLSEARGQQGSLADIKHNIDLMVKIYTGTGGKVTPKDMDQFMRNFGQGAHTATDKSIQEYASVIDQMIIAGEGGGSQGGGAPRAATTFKMIQAYLNGKKMNKQGAAMFEETGFYKPNSILPGSTTTEANIKQGASTSPGLSLSDVPAYLDKMLPNVLAYTRRHAKEYYAGKDVNHLTVEDQNQAIQRYITALGVSVSAAQALMILWDPKSNQRIHSQQGNIQKSFNTDQSQAIISTSQVQAITTFNAQLDALKIALGSTILPAITNVITAINDMVGALAKFSTDHPIFAAIAEFTAAIGSAALVILGFANMVGVTFALRGLTKALLASGTAATVATAEVTVAGDAAVASGGEAAAAATLWETSFARIGAAARLLVTPLTAAVGLLALLHSKDANAGEDAMVAQMQKPVAPGQANVWHQYPHGLPPSASTKSTMPDATEPTAAPDSALGPNASLLPSKAAANKAKHEKERLAREKIDYFITDSQYANHQAAKEIKAFNDAQKKFAEHIKKLTTEVDAAAGGQNKPQAIRDHWNGVAKELAAGGAHAEATKATAVGHRLSIKAELDEAKKVLSELQQTLREKEKVTAAQVQSGQLTKIQGTDQTIAQQKDAAPGLLTAADNVMQLEQALGQTTGAIQATIAGIKGLGHTMSQFQGDAQKTVQGGFQQLFSSMMRGNETWRLMGAQLNNSLLAGMNSAISQTMSQALSQSLNSSISGITGAAGNAAQGTGTFLGSMLGGNVSGAFGQAGTALSSLFGNIGTASTYGTSVGSAQTAMLAAQDAGMAGATTSAAAGASTAASAGSWLSTIASLFSSFAVGADNIPNDMVANIHKGEMIIPAAGAEAIRSGKLGAQGHTVHMNIHAMDSQSVMGAMVGIKRELAGMLGATNTNLNMG